MHVVQILYSAINDSMKNILFIFES